MTGILSSEFDGERAGDYSLKSTRTLVHDFTRTPSFSPGEKDERRILCCAASLSTSCAPRTTRGGRRRRGLRARELFEARLFGGHALGHFFVHLGCIDGRSGRCCGRRTEYGSRGGGGDGRGGGLRLHDGRLRGNRLRGRLAH